MNEVKLRRRRDRRRETNGAVGGRMGKSRRGEMIGLQAATRSHGG